MTAPKQYNKQLIQQMVNEGRSKNEIAKAAGINRSYLRQLYSRLGISVQAPIDTVYRAMSNDELTEVLIDGLIPGCQCPTCKAIREIEYRRAKNTHKECET